MARKTKYTPERLEKILAAIRKGKTYKDASKLAGINPDTFFDWLKNKPDFSDAIKKAEREYLDWYDENLVKDAKSSLMELIRGTEQVIVKTKTYVHNGKKVEETIEERKTIPPNATAIIFALCNRAPDEWSNKHIQELTGKIETETKSGISLSNVPDDLLGKVIDAINNGK